MHIFRFVEHYHEHLQVMCAAIDPRSLRCRFMARFNSKPCH
jgi:hypothetical protein